MADTVKTRAQLVNRALKLLGKVTSGESAAIEDYTSVDDEVDPVLAQLGADDILSIGDPDEIPLEYFEPIARLLANTCAPDFGMPMDQAARQADEQTLRRLTSGRAGYTPLVSEYF